MTPPKSEKETWEWIEIKGKKFIRSRFLYEKGFKHGFFTLNFKDQKPQELIKYLQKKSSVHYCKQVHGCQVVLASNPIHLPQKKQMV